MKITKASYWKVQYELEHDDKLMAQESERRLRDEYSRYSEAIDQLMRDVALEIADNFGHPTSIATGKLIAALAKASATVLKAKQP